MKKAATKAEREHMGRVASLGCLICHCPALVHHIHYSYGKRASHFDTLPLCPYHHQTGPFGQAIHNGAKTFQENYGTEQELLETTRELLKLKYGKEET